MYKVLKELLPNSDHLYYEVTDEELSLIEVHKFVTEYQGSRVVGTDVPVPAIAGKEVREQNFSFL
jgi:hypothetical protein